ncbi:MAG: Ig-like domain-containing protein [Acidimicrobiales bacterium]
MARFRGTRQSTSSRSSAPEGQTEISWQRLPGGSTGAPDQPGDHTDVAAPAAPRASAAAAPASSAQASEPTLAGAPANGLASSANPSALGQPVTFAALVRSSTSRTPTGRVVFADGRATLGVAPLDAVGQAVVTTSELGVGDHDITAHYSGDATFAPSSATLRQEVQRGGVTVSMAPSGNSVFGEVVAFLATVCAFGPGTPTGTVTFRSGTTVLGTVAVDADGKAAIPEISLGTGSHAITATYNGDRDFAPGSAGLTHATLAPTRTSVGVAPDPSALDEALTLVATVTSPALGIPTGAVAFSSDLSPLGTAELDADGVATLSAPAAGPGHRAILATYAGDADFAPSSAALTHVVERAETTITVATVAEAMPPQSANGSDHEPLRFEEPSADSSLELTAGD